MQSEISKTEKDTDHINHLYAEYKKQMNKQTKQMNRPHKHMDTKKRAVIHNYSTTHCLNQWYTGNVLQLTYLGGRNPGL